MGFVADQLDRIEAAAGEDAGGVVVGDDGQVQTDAQAEEAPRPMSPIVWVGLLLLAWAVLR